LLNFQIYIYFFLLGAGTTNDGNTARKFFKNAETSAIITGLDVRLIQRFANILYAISSHHEINSKTFKSYTLETAKLYVSLYPWYYMPSSVHKILIHGADIVQYALLPMGKFYCLTKKKKDYLI